MSQIGLDKNKNTFKNSQSNNSAPNNSTNNSNSSNDVARSGVTNGSYGVYTQPSSNSYNATSYVNQNLEDAEREYQEQMHSYSSNRGANTQSNGRLLYETNASSYSTQRNFSFADSNVGRTMPKGTQFKLENFAKSTVSGTASMVYGMSQIGQNEAGRGLSIAKNTIVIGGSLAVATTVAIPKQLCRAAMKSSARQEFGSIKEMKEALKEINKTMKKHGLPPLRGSGNNLWIESRKALRRLRRSNAPQELIEAAEKGMRIGKYTSFNKKGASRGFKRSVRFVANEFTKYLNQNDVGRGLSYIN